MARQWVDGTQAGRKTVLLHPFVVFSAVWLSVVFLYSLHLSGLLRYSTEEVVGTTAYIWIPFATVVTLYTVFHHFSKLAYCPKFTALAVDIELLEKRLTVWFRIWFAISIIEIIVSHGIPIVWLIEHNAKTYVDFGITSLHGLVNSLLVSIAVCRVALFFITGERRNLKVPVFVVVWSILVVTRQLMMSALVEYAVVFLSLKVVKAATILRIAVSVALVILAFGFIGDFRTGSEAFRLLAEPTAKYPTWLPSGVLWVYIYVTTPINNLMYTAHSFRPLEDFLFPNTASTLFPTFIRSALYGSQVGQAQSGNLVTQAFNVSTAYIGPFQDYGMFGVTLFSILTAFACQFYWYCKHLRDLLIFAVLTQCLAFTLFFNLFFALPVITQILWLFYLFMPAMRLGKRSNSMRRSSALSHLGEIDAG